LVLGNELGGGNGLVLKAGGLGFLLRLGNKLLKLKDGKNLLKLNAPLDWGTGAITLVKSITLLV